MHTDSLAGRMEMLVTSVHFQLILPSCIRSKKKYYHHAYNFSTEIKKVLIGI